MAFCNTNQEQHTLSHTGGRNKSDEKHNACEKGGFCVVAVDAKQMPSLYLLPPPLNVPHKNKGLSFDLCSAVASSSGR